MERNNISKLCKIGAQILAAGLIAVWISGCGSQGNSVQGAAAPIQSGEEISARQYLEKLNGSISFDVESGTLRFTVPEDALAEGQTLSLKVMGRTLTETGEGMSYHMSESWEGGKTYEERFGKGGLDTCIIDGAILQADGQRVEESSYEIDGGTGIIGQTRMDWYFCVGMYSETDQPGTLADLLTGGQGALEAYFKLGDGIATLTGEGLPDEKEKQPLSDQDSALKKYYEDYFAPVMTWDGFESLLSNRVLTSFVQGESLKDGVEPASRSYRVTPISENSKGEGTDLTVKIEADLDGKEVSHTYQMELTREDGTNQIAHIVCTE